jgi:hypothetical protein
VLSSSYFIVAVSLFFDAFSVTRLYSVNDRVISKLRSNGKDLAGSGRGLILRYYPGICLEGLRRTTKDLNQDSRSPGPRFEPGTSRIRSSVINHSTTTFRELLHVLLKYQYGMKLHLLEDHIRHVIDNKSQIITCQLSQDN